MGSLFATYLFFIDIVWALTRLLTFRIKQAIEPSIVQFIVQFASELVEKSKSLSWFCGVLFVASFR